MKRKEFLKKGLTLIGTAPLVASCGAVGAIDTNQKLGGLGSTNEDSAGNCEITPSETAGPFPTKNPNSLIYQDITLDRTGIPLNINLTIINANTGCKVLENARVDIWHCDADGSYSEYGGIRMQTTNYTNAHFLRGRQITDGNGQVIFKSIFPGWYNGRAVHIHVQVFDGLGKSLLTTQIAFPKEICDLVYTEAMDFYKKGLADTSNERDNIFRDGFDDEMGTVTGSINEGFDLIHTIVVNG